MKKNKGITLIALVITIIVLLILAGVTINAIVGNESAMEKAKQARAENEKGNELDTIKLAVVDAISKGNDGQIKLSDLNASLTGLVTSEATGDSPWIVTGNIAGRMYRITSYGEVTEIKGVVLKTKTLKVSPGKSKEIEAINVTGQELEWTPANSNGVTVTKGTGDKATVAVASDAVIGTKITVTASAGDESDTCEVEVVFDKAGAINSKIGNNVDYSVTYKDASNNDVTVNKWQVFYADEDNNEVFIISEEILETNTSVGDDLKKRAYPDGSAEESLLEGTYGGKYNELWLGVENAGLNGITVNDNAKVTAYLCDSTNTNWNKYAGGTFGTGTGAKLGSSLGVYAVGGPTVELLQASVREYDSSKLNGTFSPTAVGYNKPFNLLSTPYLAQYTKSDNTKENGWWWLASPENDADVFICCIESNGNVNHHNVTFKMSWFGVRPLVSIPLDKFETSWINE